MKRLLFLILLFPALIHAADQELLPNKILVIAEDSDARLDFITDSLRRYLSDYSNLIVMEDFQFSNSVDNLGIENFILSNRIQGIVVTSIEESNDNETLVVVLTGIDGEILRAGVEMNSENSSYQYLGVGPAREIADALLLREPELVVIEETTHKAVGKFEYYWPTFMLSLGTSVFRSYDDVEDYIFDQIAPLINIGIDFKYHWWGAYIGFEFMVSPFMNLINPKLGFNINLLEGVITLRPGIGFVSYHTTTTGTDGTNQYEGQTSLFYPVFSFQAYINVSKQYSFAMEFLFTSESLGNREFDVTSLGLNIPLHSVIDAVSFLEGLIVSHRFQINSNWSLENNWSFHIPLEQIENAPSYHFNGTFVAVNLSAVYRFELGGHDE